MSSSNENDPNSLVISSHDNEVPRTESTNPIPESGVGQSAEFITGNVVLPSIEGTTHPSESASIEFRLDDLSNTDRCVFLVYERIKDSPAALQILQLFKSFLGSLVRREPEASRADCARQIIEIGLPCISDQEELKHPISSALARLYSARFRRSDDPADIAKAIQFYDQAHSISPHGDPNKPTYLDNLGAAYSLQFDRLGILRDLACAIDCHTQSLLLIPEVHPDRSLRLSNLGASLVARFSRTGDLDDLESAFQHLSQAASLTPEGHLDRPVRLLNLASAHATRFDRLGDLSELQQAIHILSKAALLVPDNSLIKPNLLGDLGNALHNRFNRLGDIPDLESALMHLQTAIQLTPKSDTNMPNLLDKLGCSQRTRFCQLANLADLDAAIANQTMAVSLTLDGHPKKVGLLNNLGLSHKVRWGRLFEIADLKKAIKHQKQALQLLPEGHKDIAICSGNLGISYTSLFHYEKTRSDLDGAVEYLSQAVQLTPDGHRNKAAWLMYLGETLIDRFNDRHNLEDCSNAILYQKQALSLAPTGHLQIPDWLDSLGKSYNSRFTFSGEQGDIDIAIAHKSQAYELLLQQNHSSFHVLFSLGKSYLDRFRHFGGSDSLDQAIRRFQAAAQVTSGSPIARMQAAHSWAEAVLLSPEQSPLQAFGYFVDLIPQAVWLGGTTEDKYSQAIGLSTFTAEAAAVAIQCQRYDLALEWMEEGCSIVWKQMLQLRTPLDDLRASHPEIAQSLEETAQMLDQASTKDRNNTDIDSITWENSAQSHHRLAEKYERLLNDIHGLPGFSDFMRPKKASVLASAARRGPIVAINIHDRRCDALVLHPDSGAITHVPLPQMSIEAARAALCQLKQFLDELSLRQRGFITSGVPTSLDMLAILWCKIVQPVLEDLGYLTQSPGQELPHISWWTSGSLAPLPLHAAGCYDEPRSKVFDYVVSSYTPTLSALLAVAPDPSSFCGILAAGIVDTPGQDCPLPGIMAEIAQVENKAGAHSFKKLLENKATITAVMDAMEKYSWIHMACHASQNLDDPAKSAFHLYDGELELSAIMRKSLKEKGLAFLSACETAKGDDDLPGEAVHLAAGMLMAGYRSVIGTMWSIEDQDAPLIAEKVYAGLLEGGVADTKKTAKALHDAIACLRGKVGEKNFARWVPYIHLGL